MGKNLLTKYVRFIVGAYDISGDIRQAGELRSVVEKVDMTSILNDDIKNALGGNIDIGISGYQAMMNDATGGSLPVLDDGDYVPVSVLFGSGGEPAPGDPVYMIEALVMGDPVNISGAVVLSPTFEAYAVEQCQPFGSLLFNGSLTETGDQATVDLVAGYPDGFVAFLHITATSSGDYEFEIEDSDDGITWGTVATFTIDGSAINSEVIRSDDDVKRYARLACTRTAGSVSVVCVIKGK